MEIESAYLRAIQEIPGKRPNEKYKELNEIAKKMSQTKHGDSAAVKNIPEPLLPLVEIEIANISKNYKVVVEALKSEDSVIINKVMGMRWFFRGDNKDIINIDYFDKNVFPFVSLSTRSQIIKKLALNLRASGETGTAENFYTRLAKRYDRKQSEPLLVACGKSFVSDIIKTNESILSCKTVGDLFYRYPEVIITYLKLSKPDNDSTTRKPRLVPIRKYSNFLPRLIKNYVKDFVELLEAHDSCFDIVLSNKASESFLKNNVEVLLNKPRLYLQLMPLKVIAAKLTKRQFECMFYKLLPERIDEFSYWALEKYLEHIPKYERAAIVIDAYREAYGKNLLDNSDDIDSDFLAILPVDDRVKEARIKLAAQPDWRKNFSKVERVWRCYLPTSESIPSIKSEISKSGSDIDIREKLLIQLFYTCKINEDQNAFLDALLYFTTRHKNEQSFLIFDVLGEIVNRFDLASVSLGHWSAIDDFIRFLYIKGEIVKHSYKVISLLAAGVHFNIINDISTEEKIGLIVELRCTDYARWNILEKYPKYERRCLEECINLIPSKYPIDGDVWKAKRMDAVESLVKSIYNFNSRNSEEKSKVEKMSIKSYSWLLNEVKSIVTDTSDRLPWTVASLKTMMRENEIDLYNEWIPEEEKKIAQITTGEALARLSKDPQNILDNYQKYLENARDDIFRKSFAQRFIRATRWYQDIPIKFLDYCFQDLRREDKDVRSIVLLGLLLEGDEFGRFIEPLVPKDMKIDVGHGEAETNYKIIQIIPKTMNLVNPPVPLELILNFCQGDYLQLGLTSLTRTCRRVDVDKIEPFTKTLVDRPVSVKKHGIRMFCLVASIQDLRDFLTILWKNEKHPSIRAVIFENIYNLFVNDLIEETWDIMKNCIAEFKIDDDTGLKKLTNLSPIPNRFIVEYIKQLLETIEKLEANGFSEEIAAKYLSEIIFSINKPIGKLFDEDFAQQLVVKYFCNPCLHPDVSFAGNSYVTQVYLYATEDKFEQRLKTLCNLYENILQKQWNVPHPKFPLYFPINYLAARFMDELVDFSLEVDTNVGCRVMEAILKSFITVLKPQCSFESYTLLTLGIALKDAKTTDEIIERIVDTLPALVDTVGDKIAVCMDSSVKRWFNTRVDRKENEAGLYSLVEKLCKVGTIHSCLLAVKLLDGLNSSKFQSRYIKVIEFLRNSCYPDVVSLVYLHVNQTTL